MATTHDIGKQHFVQYLGFYPALWKSRIWAKGWTQEISEPFRTGDTLIVRLPFKRAIAFGKWIGELDEEQALSRAIEERVLTDEDFQEGWTPPAYEAPEEDFWALNS
jgi:hypothetical protein